MIIDENAKQVKSLEKKLDNLNKDNENKALSIINYTNTIHDLQTKCTKLEQDNTDCIRKNEELATIIEKKQQEMLNLQQSNQYYLNEINISNENTKERDKLEKEKLKLQESQKDSLEKQVARLEENIEKLKQSVKQKQNEIDLLKQSIKDHALHLKDQKLGIIFTKYFLLANIINA